MTTGKVVEKIVEKFPGCGGLRIAAGKEKSPKPIDNQGFWALVPVTGLEPVRCRQRWILSPLRLPFHHTGMMRLRCFYSIVYFC